MTNREAYEKTCEEAKRYRELISLLQKYKITLFDEGKILHICDEPSGRLLLARRIKKKETE